MYCGNCGQKLPDNYKVCTRCGCAVERGSAYRFAPPGENTRQVGTYAADPWRQTQPARTRPKKKKRRLLPLLLLILLAAVAVLLLKEDSGVSALSSKRLPSVPMELRDHTFLKSRAQGPCNKLEGSVGITVIFVDDGESSWAQEDMDAYMSAVYADISGMTQDAAIWGRELYASVDTAQCRVTGTVTDELTDTFVDPILSAAGLPTENFHDHLEEELGVEQAPVVFVLNKPGRASAKMGGKEEYCFLFDDVTAFRHELFHLFGAEDLYYPAEVTAIAESCFTESIMLGYDSDAVDDLTAYLIGWSNSLSEDALSFLNQTTWVTEESLLEAYEEEALTGYGTREYADGIYTGNLTMGVPNGWGTLVMNNGDKFEGQFVSGVRTGAGTYYWSNGDVFQGTFENDARTGFGTFTWNNGDTYQGNFEKDVRTGWGIYTWADGTRYEGDFLEDEMTGTGTFYWTDGSIFSGEFRNGALHGRGTLTYPDGETISGTWHNNEYLG